MRTNIFDITRNIYRKQATLGSAFRDEDGAIDLASIMVGIIVIGLIGGIIAATVFAVIPWSQDNAAKQQLDSVASAESAYVGLSTQGSAASFGDANDLLNKNLFNAANAGVKIEKTGSGNTSHYGAADRSASGKYFYITDTMTQPTGVSADPTATDGVLNGVSLTAAGWTGSYTASGSSSASASPSASATPTSTHLFTSLALAQQSGAPANSSGIATSSNGSILVDSNDVGGGSNGYLTRSTDGGKTWTNLTSAGNRSWYGVSSSSDGQTILAAAWNDMVYLSKDGGNTWTSNPGTVTGSSDAGVTPASTLGTTTWTGTAVSRNGQYMAVASSGNGSGHVWYSSDGGNTWTQHGVSNFQAVSISDDGNVIAAASSSLSEWDMTISGTKGAAANWAQQGPSVTADYTGISVSGDGKTVLAGMNNQYGSLVVGTRATNDMTTGFTYTQLGTGGNNAGVPWDAYHVAISQDGTKALAVGYKNNDVLTSTNLTAHPATTDPVWPNYPAVSNGLFSGAKFTSQTVPNAQWWGVAMSDDGANVAFGSINGVTLETGAWN